MGVPSTRVNRNGHSARSLLDSGGTTEPGRRFRAPFCVDRDVEAR
jgi:hypothetical protein